MIPSQLAKEVESLRGEGFTVDLHDMGDWAEIVIHDRPLPPSLNKSSTTLRLKFPAAYPNGKPDMFWTEEGVLLTNGQVPRSADCIEEAHGKRWRRFSWHPKSWCPGIDGLRTFLEFVNSRLAKAE